MCQYKFKGNLLKLNDNIAICDAIGHPPGRPKIGKLKGMKRASEKIIKQSQRCSKCGESGHNARSCKKQIGGS
jgi:hypothetical protein